DGREYVMPHRAGQATPAPWINVIANAQMGFQVASEGSGFSWALNSQQNQLTPWPNDPVENPGGDAVYLKDLDSGALWSPTPFPSAAPGGEYLTRHGQGYSRFESACGPTTTSLTQFMAQEDAVK